MQDPPGERLTCGASAGSCFGEIGPTLAMTHVQADGNRHPDRLLDPVPPPPVVRLPAECESFR